MSSSPGTHSCTPDCQPKLDWTHRAIICLASLGVLDTLYLLWVKLADRASLCTGMGDCAKVNSSSYSELLGIPIAAFGFAVYIAILVLSALESRRSITPGLSILAAFGLSLFGVIYSVWLTYVEVAVLRAICPFCLASAIVIGAILVVSTVRVKRHVTDV